MRSKQIGKDIKHAQINHSQSDQYHAFRNGWGKYNAKYRTQCVPDDGLFPKHLINGWLI